MAKQLKGKDVSDALTSKIFEDVAKLKDKNIQPCLAILRVGQRAEDISYEKGATKRCETVGIGVKHFILGEEVSQQELLEVIRDINEDPQIHGVLLFRPLPPHLDEKKATEALDPAKDVDGITPLSMAGVYSASEIGFSPCTPRACMEILDYYGIDLVGKNVVIIGRSLVVGKPAAMMALKKNATVTICHTKTKELEYIAKQADILIVAAGKPKAIGAGFFREGQVVIDVGIHLTEEGTLCGDVDFMVADPIVHAITPVPGGVGTVTTGVLALQVVEAAARQGDKR